MTASDPELESRVRAGLASQKLMTLIGARVTHIAAGECEIEVPMREDLGQQDGFMHAGIVTTILDNACGYAAYSLMPEGSRLLSVEFKVNFLAPAKGEIVRAVGTVKRAGKTLTVCTGDAFADGTLCATMLATMICIR